MCHEKISDTYFQNLEGISNIKIIGNLPFGVASPMLIELIRAMHSKPSPNSNKFQKLLYEIPYVDFLFMFQEEVAQVTI